MSNSILFNSKTDPIPQVRPDIDVIPVDNNGQSYLYFHDMRGYVTPNFALDRSAENILSLLDGHKSINDLKPYLGNGVSTDTLLEYVRFLDENRLLYSHHYKAFAEQIEQKYEAAKIHESVTAGSSYPADPTELTEFLDDAFEKNSSANPSVKPEAVKALYAPHIDPRVGIKSYVKSFNAIREAKPSRVVILATSHYAGLYPDIYQNSPFIVSSKDFVMPGGTVPADQEAIHTMEQNAEAMGVSFQDRAHRIEHSIELHLLFLQHIWDHDLSIIPVVVSGFDELYYMNGSHLSRQLEQFSKYLQQEFGDDPDTLFLISGDLAHVGKKFGDEQAANLMKNEVKRFDKQFLAAGISGSTDSMLSLMKRSYDPYRICGFPPLYTFLNAFPGVNGQTISYDRWDETERESAVTFGSILYQ